MINGMVRKKVKWKVLEVGKYFCPYCMNQIHFDANEIKKGNAELPEECSKCHRRMIERNEVVE